MIKILLSLASLCCTLEGYSQGILLTLANPKNNSLNLSYNQRELGNAFGILNKEISTLSIHTNIEQVISCDEIKSKTFIYAEPNDTLHLSIDKDGLLNYYSLSNNFRKNESALINDLYKKFGPITSIDYKNAWIKFSGKKNTPIENDELFIKQSQLIDEHFAKNEISAGFRKYFKSIFWSLSIINLCKKEGANLSIKEKILRNSEIEYLIKIPEFREALLYFTIQEMRMKKVKPTLYNTIQYIDASYQNSIITDYLTYNRIQHHILYKKDKIETPVLQFVKEKMRNHEFKNELITEISGSAKYSVTWPIIRSHSNKIILLDFWASWCVPCINEFPFQKQLMIEFPDLIVLFISTDKSISAWKEATKKYTEILSEKNSYHIGIMSKSELVKAFNISSIPRYILINKKGEVIDKNAPRPSDPKLKEIIRQHINQF